MRIALALLFSIALGVSYGQNSGVIVLGNSNGGNDTLTVTKVSIFNNTSKVTPNATSATMSYEEEVVNQCGITLSASDTLFTVPPGGYIVAFRQSVMDPSESIYNKCTIAMQSGAGVVATSYLGIGSSSGATYITVESDTDYWFTSDALYSNGFGESSGVNGQVIFTKIR